MGTRRDSTTLTGYEKALIRTDYLVARARKWNHEQAVAEVAERHKVNDATVRLLVLEPTQTELRV